MDTANKLERNELESPCGVFISIAPRKSDLCAIATHPTRHFREGVCDGINGVRSGPAVLWYVVAVRGHESIAVVLKVGPE